MLDLIVGYWKSFGVHVAARLGLADQLAKGAKSVDELAAATKTHRPTLFRFLRMLASFGVFRERPDGKFENTELSDTLRVDAPGSMRGFAIMMVENYNVQAWGGLLESLKSGAIAFDRIYGKPIFEWIAEHPSEAREFADAMSSLSKSEAPVIAEAIDVGGVKKLLDVGGSHGVLLAAILRRNPKLRGFVYDRPEVVANAKKDEPARDPAIAGRLEFVAGDFFQSVPAGADACIMKYIMHDWTDEQCTTILTNCRKALGASGRLFVCDNVIPAGNDPHWGKLLDINMLLLPGGRERTRDEFAKLFAGAGFKLTRVTPTRGPLSIVEGVAT
jgi:hypothetical protein